MMSTSDRAKRFASAAAICALSAVLLSACGSSMSDADFAAAERGGLSATAVDAGINSAPAAGTVATGTDAVADGSATGAAATHPGQAVPVAPGVSAAASGGTVGGAGATSGVPAAGAPAKNGTRAGTGSTAPALAAGAPCTSQGAPIVLGQVVSSAGLIGQNVGSAVPTLQAWAKAVNARGGIACHPVQVVSQDDGSDPARAASAVSDLVRNRKAVALVANFVPLSISGFHSAVAKEGVPVIGGDLFSLDWWQDGLFYPVGTYVDANGIGATAAAAKKGGDKVGVLYCLESSVCPPYKDAVKRGAAANGYSVVYDAQVSLTQPDFTPQCQNAKNAGATQISSLIDGSAVARLARSCASIGYYPKLAIGSLAATFDQGDPNIRRATLSLASASGPWFDTGIPGQKEYLDSMSRYAGSLTLNPSSSLAWIDGMMAEKALEKLGASARTTAITTEMIRTGLSMIKNETLDGMVAPTTFSPSRGPNPKNMCYFPVDFAIKYTGTKEYRCLN
jgi:branched-chain amino acid transport system substrate-binding protein